MRFLRVGDPHVKPNNIKESERLFQFILDKCVELNIDVLEILGDLFDTHRIVHLEVLEFWTKWLAIFAQQSFKVRVLVGNHDVTGDYSNKFSALHPFLSLENANFKIIHEPFVDGVYGYLPYIHGNAQFIEEANKLASQGVTVLVSHPNYDGGVYDNGHPISGAVNTDLLMDSFLHLIGGHIHTELEFKRVWYTGNPRWMTKSCANKAKGIWFSEHAPNGQRLTKEFISTESVCTKIVSLQWNEGENCPEIPEGCKVDIELVGASDWVTAQKLALKGKVSLSSKLTDVKKSKTRKAGKSLFEFISEHYSAKPEKRAALIEYMKGLNLV